MAHKPGHPNKKMKSFMDSLNIKNKAIKYMAELKKIDSMYSRNKDGFPYRKSTGTMVPPHKKTKSDSVVVRKKRGN